MAKILFDRSLSVLLLVLLSPLIAFVALAVLIAHGRSIFLRQPRPGLGGKLFTLYKFRTMTDERGEDGELLPDARRITRFGAFLRSSSLDELPELWNIARGDMSFVGPRPLLVEYLPLYSTRQARRHDVLPGLTGLAQIKGRNATSWDHRLELDVRYVEERDFAMDMAILARTFLQVLRPAGIAHEGHATMPKFTGAE
ncbi:sugar transferase [Sphingopyxis macrogoltabida]|uniref:Bacterial sugar transferase domain-containing protein n=1 Tax=Sphingopyxis macrogoltabida TaxID=33050 RepID=A0AAC8Z003_SPHMC|nr:sugar transferase [Sphingopyxis macrogoltabida]ALJ13229.1 hypothetical protein LH19_10155 [Sphingopyxis macrogoltabida]AMU89306.1 hypothetical protein ATM17_09680 [Sphingopyxis macrogoltabida]